MRVLDTLFNILLNHVFQHFNNKEDRFIKGPDYNQQCLKRYSIIKQL